MNSDLRINPPIWFWIIAILALVWNGMGLLAFVSQMNLTAEDIAGLSEIDQDLMAATPSWVNMAFGAAVIFGVLGSLALLFRKSWASTLYMISLLAVLAQMTYMFFFSQIFSVKGWDQAFMPAFIIVVALFLWSYAVKALARHWIY